MPIPLKSIPQPTLDALRASVTARIEVMRGYRLSFWTHWRELAEMLMPRRYRSWVTPNQFSRGLMINQAIVDETGLLAARTLATGLLANLTSPTKPWFRLGIHGVENQDEGPVAEWLAECTRRMLDVYAGSNLYTALGQAYHDNCVFGSAPLIQYEDIHDVVRFYNPCAGEFFFGLDNRLTVNALYVEYTYTVQETVEEFGLENVSESTRTSYTSGGSGKDNEIVVCCAIEPNEEVWQSDQNFGQAIPSKFKYREIYWEQAASQGTSKGSILRVAGFNDKPFVGLRWDVTSNDAYGRSPGMDALPAVRQLQLEQRRKAEAIDKMVRPPMVASVGMKNEPMDITPGGVSFVADPSANGFKPAFTVEPRIAELMEDLKEVQDRVKQVFFNPLFTGISDLQTVRTATEIDARVQEKLVLLGPVVERIENEGLDEIISRTFEIMSRRGLFPPAPDSIQGSSISIQYISILAEAQRAAATAAIERVFAFAGGMVAVWPQAGDNLDPDVALDNYADLLNLNPEIVRAAAAVAQIRAARAAQAQAAATMQTGTALAEGAQTLSQTPIGGGKSALQAVIGQ